jgi:hypothetical protein
MEGDFVHFFEAFPSVGAQFVDEILRAIGFIGAQSDRPRADPGTARSSARPQALLQWARPKAEPGFLARSFAIDARLGIAGRGVCSRSENLGL